MSDNAACAQEAVKLGKQVAATAEEVLGLLGGRDVEAFLEDKVHRLLSLKQPQRRENIHRVRSHFRHQSSILEALQTNIVALVACNEDSNTADQFARVAKEVDSHLLELLAAVEECTFTERAAKKGLEDGGFSFCMDMVDSNDLGSEGED